MHSFFNEAKEENPILTLLDSCKAVHSAAILKLTDSDKNHLGQTFEKYSQMYLQNKHNSLGANALVELGLMYEALGIQYFDIGSSGNWDSEMRNFSDQIRDKSGMLYVAAADLNYLPAILKAGDYFGYFKYLRDFYRPDLAISEADQEKIRHEDKRLSFHYYRLAACKNHSPSVKKIMYFYLEGFGVSKDLDRALKYLNKAKSYGGIYFMWPEYGRIALEVGKYEHEKYRDEQEALTAVASLFSESGSDDDVNANLSKNTIRMWK